MSKSGEYLSKQLGLNKLKNVRIGRLLMSTFRVYLIVYDTRLPNRPITNSEVKHLSYVLPGLVYPFEEKPTMLPLIDLKDFNGSFNNAMFFAFDLAGRLNDPRKLTKVFESDSGDAAPPIFSGNLEEFVKFSDLKGADTLGSITKRTRRTRNSELGTENKLAKLVDVNIDTVKDHVTFIFNTQATTPIYPDDHPFKKTDPSNFSLKRNPDKEYELHLRVLNFFEWLKDTKPDAEKITLQDVKDVIRVNNVQVFSTSPSFHWQGMNYNASQLDGSIYPTDIAPTVWDKRQGSDDYLLDKHLYGLIKQIDFFANPMASMLTKRLKSRDLI